MIKRPSALIKRPSASSQPATSATEDAFGAEGRPSEPPRGVRGRGPQRAVSRGPGVVPERQPATDRWPLNSITLNPVPNKARNVSILLYIGMINRPSALIKRPLA